MKLWSTVRDATDRAIQTGALQPIRTRQTTIDDGGVRFLVRIVDGRSAKPIAADNPQKKGNPFLPYDPQLYVADIPPHHVGLLNKFPVVDQHLLVVTRQFEEQSSDLTLADFQALCYCLSIAAKERAALAFYNGGREAGASQSHKHLQFVPLPLADDGPSFPLEPLLIGATTEQIQQARKVPFEHSLVQFSSPVETNAAQHLHQLYLAMLDQHQLWHEGQKLTFAYNLIVTRDLMLLVPRVCECFHNVSLNALAFVGALLVKDDGQCEMLKREGPWAALKSVARTPGALRNT